MNAQSRITAGGEVSRPHTMLDRPGGHWACKRSLPLLRNLDFWKP